MRTHLYLVMIIAVMSIISQLMPAHAQSWRSDERVSPRFTGGLGIGVMYGGLGTNIEYRATDQASVTAGVGLDGHGQWLLGGRYYFKPEGAGPRGRFTLGLASVESDTDLFPAHRDRVLKGILAIGWSAANAENSFRGWDFDITTEARLSVGYHF